ncbi:Sau3AI family type II restriction endonuclease [Butyrivibrio sp. LB2008]|uniref:Sau3AI family type II restriction endonuclease n=1 Tax=Butyrivibrio sp. LB2008 TaxID=1408305 RepID=UPI00047A8CD3|nr:Sau3AI family type II restriction endonuclease [Butyrivibrio sp. LB2008]
MDIKIELGYDKTKPKSIEAYAQKLIGRSFRQVMEDDSNAIREDGTTYGKSDVAETKRNKGNVGQIIEECFFHYSCNSDARADFPEAGVELKVTPYKENKNGTLSAKERLILTMIDYMTVVNEDFETSHFWNKSKLILLIYYLYKQEVKFNLDYRIGYAKLFTPPEQDLKIIKHDYEIIVEKIRAGKAHELSEGDTLYLGAATKSSTSEVRRKQPYSDIPAKPRAFTFKNSYMTYVLNNYIIPGKDTYEPIVKDDSVESFEDYVVNKIGEYAGYSVDELCEKFDVDITKKAKNLGAMLAYRILGIKSNQAEEFEKANIVLKTIRIGSNNKIKESMSFPTFKFKELVQEEWDDSTFGNYLRETRFLFVVYKFDENDKLHLKGAQFWNIPYEDLENDVRQMWERTVQVLKEGLKVEKINGINHNNFPKATENRVSHVRPHAQNAKDTYELPDGREYPKQCFWLNNTYILEQIDERLK